MERRIENQSRSTAALRALGVVLLLAALARILFWVQIHDLELYRTPTGDAATNLILAQELGRDGPLAPLGQPYQRAPLYPAFLWLWGTLGLGLSAVPIIQFALGVAGAGLLWALGRRTAGRVGGWVAGLGGALYGPFIFFESELLSISLAIFLLEVGLVLWGRTRWALVTGALFGLSALSQPNMLLAGAIAAGFAVVKPGWMGWPHRRAVWLLVLGLALPPTATLVRNLSVSGEPVPISINGGVNFFIGNNPVADGTFKLPPDSGLLNRAEGLFTSAREVAEQATGRELDHRGVDRYWWMRGVDYWLTQPGRAIGLLMGKTLLVLNNVEIPSHYDYAYYREKAPVLWGLPTMGWLLPFGGLGLILALRRRQGWLPVLALGVLLSVIPFFVTARYRLPLAVVLWPAAGLAVQALWAERRRARSLAVLAGGAILYAGLSFIPLYHGGMVRAHMLNVEGAALVSKGDLVRGRKAIERALEVNPNHAEALNNLAYTYVLEGDYPKALPYYRRAIALNPMQAETYLNVEEIYRKTGRNADALEILNQLEAARGGTIEDVAAAVDYRRGVNSAALGDTTAAIRYFEETVARDPALAGAWLNLSILRRKLGDDAGALVAAEQAASAAPSLAEAQTNLGLARENTHRYEEALTAYRQAAAIGAVDPELHFRIGRVLLRLDRTQEAEQELLAANQGRPHPAALWALAVMYEQEQRWDEAITAFTALTRIQAPTAKEAEQHLLKIRHLGSRKR